MKDLMDQITVILLIYLVFVILKIMIELRNIIFMEVLLLGVVIC